MNTADYLQALFMNKEAVIILQKSGMQNANQFDPSLLVVGLIFQILNEIFNILKSRFYFLG